MFFFSKHNCYLGGTVVKTCSMSIHELQFLNCVKKLLCMYSKTCAKRPLSKRPKIGHQDQLSLNAGPKYCRMLQGEHSAILSTFIKLPFIIKIFVLSIFDFIKLPFIIKIFVLSIFEWPFYTGFAAHSFNVRASFNLVIEKDMVVY